MASKLILYTLLGLLAVVLVESRGNIQIGNAIGSHIIYHEVHEKIGLPLMKRDEEIKVKGVGNEYITAIVVRDLIGTGESYIKRGGLNSKEVVIKIKGPKGGGYKFLVDVYAA